MQRIVTTAIQASISQNEQCDGTDNNCDGTIDESTAIDASTWFMDLDGDGWGFTHLVQACERPSGTVAIPGDCDDSTDTTYPTAPDL